MIGARFGKNYFGHPKYKEIIAAIKSNEKYSWIANEFKCSLSTVFNYKQKIKLMEDASKLV